MFFGRCVSLNFSLLSKKRVVRRRRRRHVFYFHSFFPLLIFLQLWLYIEIERHIHNYTNSSLCVLVCDIRICGEATTTT